MACRYFRENRKKFRETPSISSAGETLQEITKDEVDRAYKKKNACSQRLTMIYRNQVIEKEMAQNDLEREAIDDFYEEYQNKYTRKLEGWKDVIDMYVEQELKSKNNIKNKDIGNKRKRKGKEH